jgi:IclR family transcriptional regulator, pca regulon regulatory protein
MRQPSGNDTKRATFQRPGKARRRATGAFALGRDGESLDEISTRVRGAARRGNGGGRGGSGGGRIYLDGAGRVSEDRSTQAPPSDSRYSLSLGHGLAILASFSAERPVMGIAEMASALNMSRSTTHRYAATLAQLGYLEQNSARRYRLTPRCADVGLSALGSMALHERSRLHLQELRRETGWTVSLAILDGSEAMLLERLRGWRGLHEIDLRLGSCARLPVHCTAMGKVLLAGLPDAELRELLAALRLPRRGPNRITGKRALRAELERVRERGFAIDDEELIEGMRSIAVPVPDARERVLGALDLAVPATLFEGDELGDQFGGLLGEIAAGITAELVG